MGCLWIFALAFIAVASGQGPGNVRPVPMPTCPTLLFPADKMVASNWSTSDPSRTWQRAMARGVASMKRRAKVDLPTPLLARRAPAMIGSDLPRPRTWFWKKDPSCPYWQYYLKSVYAQFFGTNQWCYIIAPWYQRVRKVVCTTRSCRYRPPSLTKCEETTLRQYSVWVFCPYLNRSCRRFPWLCIKKVTFKTHQCCECFRCASWISFIKTETVAGMNMSD